MNTRSGKSARGRARMTMLARACSLAIVAGLASLAGPGCAKQPEKSVGVVADASTPSITLTDRVVETGCGSCLFGLDDSRGCETAIRVDGVVYLAEGTAVPDAEDHATGLCSSVHQARVSGKTVGGKFEATSFVMLP